MTALEDWHAAAAVANRRPPENPGSVMRCNTKAQESCRRR